MFTAVKAAMVRICSCSIYGKHILQDTFFIYAYSIGYIYIGIYQSNGGELKFNETSLVLITE